jgi:NTP pyrophosphatase (non-canonical NTP hydrolase)
MFDAQRANEEKFIAVEAEKSDIWTKENVFGTLEDLHLKEKCRFINEQIIFRLIQEACELTVALKNAKTWRKAEYFTDVNEALDEVADIMIYFMNICFAMGIDEELLTEKVLAKVAVNLKRIESKY